MAHVVIPNIAPYTPGVGGHNANQWWWVIMALMKAGWLHKASSGYGLKVVTDDPLQNKFGSLPLVRTHSNVSIGAKVGEDVTLTGLTGLVAPTASNKGGSEGCYLAITGSDSHEGTFQISAVLSANSCRARRVDGGAAVTGNDANNGAITALERDPVETIYDPMLFSGDLCWIVLRGLSMLRVEFNAGVTGEFLRGEKVTQGTAEGEVLGVTYDPVTGVGWAVILPRVNGAGAGPRGWSLGTAVTGASSSAELTPTAVTEYVVELCFHCSASAALQRTRGRMAFWWTMCALDGGTEEAQLPSTLAASVGCTEAVPPGCGGAGNAFPALGMGAVGQNNTTNVNCWHHATNYDSDSYYMGNAQVLVANAISRADRSHDGSFTFLVGCSASGQWATGGWTFQRLDDTEEGDVMPYASLAQAKAFVWDFFSGTARQAGDTNVVSPTDTLTAYGASSSDGNYVGWVSWRCRGMESGGGNIDRFCPTGSALLYPAAVAAGSTAAIALNNANDPEKVACAAVPTFVKEHPMLVNFYGLASGYSLRYRKGRPRWYAAISYGANHETYGNKMWVSPRESAVNDRYTISMIFGPWNGSSPYIFG